MSDSNRPVEGTPDEMTQSRLDAGDRSQTGPEAVAYQRLFKALGTPDPDARLPTSFAYQVMSRIIETRLAARESVATLTSIGVSVIALVAGFGALLLVSASGYGEAFDLSEISQLATQVPLSLVPVALGMLLLAIADIAINHRKGGAT